jgi:nitroimidazol reductase NimA-like FMN-containing flavoprotein (pyridoxamine 5'-phosphate oxidase superfamily)
MLPNLSNGEQGCLTVAHFGSTVLARSGFNHSADYPSIMTTGTAKLVMDKV